MAISQLMEEASWDTQPISLPFMWWPWDSRTLDLLFSINGSLSPWVICQSPETFWLSQMRCASGVWWVKTREDTNILKCTRQCPKTNSCVSKVSLALGVRNLYYTSCYCLRLRVDKLGPRPQADFTYFCVVHRLRMLSDFSNSWRRE